jgi:hypothetical protein
VKLEIMGSLAEPPWGASLQSPKMGYWFAAPPPTGLAIRILFCFAPEGITHGFSGGAIAIAQHQRAYRCVTEDRRA